MSVSIRIRDGKGTSREAFVGTEGDLLVGTPHRSLYDTVVLSDTELHTMVVPRTGYEVHVTALVLTGARDIGPEGSEVTLWIALDEQGTEKEQAIRFLIARIQSISVSLPFGDSLYVPPKRYLLASCDDPTVYVTYWYHYYKV